MIIQGGSTVLIPVNAIHYDPGINIHYDSYEIIWYSIILNINTFSEYYPDPERFEPDRFESETKKKRDPMKWLAFGDGPRNCIGLRFGMMQARIGLVALIKNFEFAISPETTIPIGISKKAFLTTPEDVYLKVKPVK